MNRSVNITDGTKLLDDSEVIDRILSGEVALYEILIRRYNGYLYKIGRSYGFGHEDAQDLMQETYVSVFRNLAAFESRSAFKTWIVRIMLNQCYHKRKSGRYTREANGTDTFDEQFYEQRAYLDR
jgi:RNA polymerase sigma-70 factor (ECF subfamily)